MYYSIKLNSFKGKKHNKSIITMHYISSLLQSYDALREKQTQIKLSSSLMDNICLIYIHIKHCKKLVIEIIQK